MKVKAIVKFNDLKEGVVREIGDEFTVSKERYEQILKVGPFVEEVATGTRKKAAAKAE